MKKVKDIWLRINRVKGLKYIIVTFLAFLFIGFLDAVSYTHLTLPTIYSV